MKHTDLDACRRTVELLPWYTNGSLAAEEKHAVKTHLDVCAACRREWILLGAIIDAMPSPHTREGGSAFGQLLQRINREERQSHGWKIAAVILVMLIAVAGIALPVYMLEPRYETVTDALPRAATNVQVRVVFDATEDIGRLGELLERYDAEVVAGPDNNQRFLLEFPLAADETAQQLQRRLENEAQIRNVEILPSR